jgi:hypothetical protein
MLLGAWTPGPYRLDAAAAYYFPSRTDPFTAAGATATFQLVTLAAHGCYDLVGTRFGVSPCANVEGGLAIGRAHQVVSPATGTALLLSTGVGGLLSWRFAVHYAVELRGDILVPLTRPEFQVDTLGVHQPAGVIGRGVLSLGIRF